MLLTTKEIALKWGVSVTWVTVLCKKGRIEGAIREGNRWYIPEDAKKPNVFRCLCNIQESWYEAGRQIIYADSSEPVKGRS